MSPAAQPVISFRASVSPPLVTCPQHPSPDTLDRAWVQVPPVPSHVSNHMPGPQVPARSLPPCPLARSAAGACESASLSGYLCRAERRKNSCSWATAHARLDQSLPVFLVPPARKASFAFSNPCQTPAHLFRFLFTCQPLAHKASGALLHITVRFSLPPLHSYSALSIPFRGQILLHLSFI